MGVDDKSGNERSGNERPFRWLAALATITLLVAACSGGDSSVSPTDTAPETTSEPTPPESTPDTTPETTTPETTTPETTVAFVPSGVMCPPTPEGRIAYQLQLEGGGVDGGDTAIVRVVRPDGSSDSELFAGDSYYGVVQPSWSPDGTRAVVLAADGPNLIIRCDGTIESVINFSMPTASFPIGIVGTYPSWSPDGSRLSVVSSDGVFIVDPTTPVSALPVSLGSGLTAAKGRASWSPEGDRLVFAATDGDENTDIYVVGTDHSGLTRLTTDPGDDYQPAWSPDGSTIAFRSTRDDRLWLMAADGSGQEPLFPSGGEGFAYQPSWSPDGTQLVYVWGDADETRVHIIGADGSGDRQLIATPALGSESWPVWVSP